MFSADVDVDDNIASQSLTLYGLQRVLASKLFAQNGVQSLMIVIDLSRLHSQLCVVPSTRGARYHSLYQYFGTELAALSGISSSRPGRYRRLIRL